MSEQLWTSLSTIVHEQNILVSDDVQLIHYKNDLEIFSWWWETKHEHEIESA